MNRKWVDNEVYFGPDRRHRDGGKRWGDRRRLNDAAEPPPLGAMLRRLRVMLTDLSAPDRRRRALDIANLAVREAERLHQPECARCIADAARLISASATDQTIRIDELLTRAQGLAQGPREFL